VIFRKQCDFIQELFQKRAALVCRGKTFVMNKDLFIAKEIQGGHAITRGCDGFSRAQACEQTNVYPYLEDTMKRRVPMVRQRLHPS
jgi:hypothetical protein